MIILSMVRSNDVGRVGFTSDRQRINVMLTRARMALLVVGDFNLLANCRIWKAVYDHAQLQDAVVQASSVPWLRRSQIRHMNLDDMRKSEAPWMLPADGKTSLQILQVLSVCCGQLGVLLLCSTAQQVD